MHALCSQSCVCYTCILHIPNHMIHACSLFPIICIHGCPYSQPCVCFWNSVMFICYSRTDTLLWLGLKVVSSLHVLVIIGRGPVCPHHDDVAVGQWCFCCIRLQVIVLPLERNWRWPCGRSSLCPWCVPRLKLTPTTLHTCIPCKYYSVYLALVYESKTAPVYSLHPPRKCMHKRARAIVTPAFESHW